jgi:predicted MPP superfamily phosphohydrolase
MKLAVAHLSDIHLRSKNDNCFGRREKLTNTIMFSKQADEVLLLVVTGDIANSGAAAEYEVATEYFGPLLNGLGIDPLKTPSRFILVPGNHDCNFENVGDLRPRLLVEIDAELERIESGGETVKTLLGVQSNFFGFHQATTGEQLTPEAKLYLSRKFEIGARQAEFRCYNSAWLSKMHEDPGSLGFPSRTFDAAAQPTDADVVITLVHHPSNWMNPGTHASFRRVVQETSDFLFTGHEHTIGGQIIAPFDRSSLVHFESGPLQPVDSGTSEFGILHIDLDKGTWTHEDFAWSKGAYVRLRQLGPHGLADKSERVASLQASRDFLDHLNDPGTGFLHPRLTNLRLSDIYTYPDLKVRKLSKKLSRAEELPPEIQSQHVIEKLLSAKRVVVAGPADSGKTALSKMLFIDGNSKHLRSCILLHGERIRGKEPAAAFSEALESAIHEQYGEQERGRYAGIHPTDRVLLIDNWEDIPFNRGGRQEIISQASERFGCIIVFSDDIFLIDELSPRHDIIPLRTFETADIREFGYRLRGQLIRKWHLLGNDFIEAELHLARHIADSTRVVDTVLGRNLLPSYPLNILTLLQTYDAGAGAQNSALGSYGQVFEALVTARLARVTTKAIDIGTTITFLSRFAWRLFEQHKKCIDDGQWKDLGRQYFDEYKIRIDYELLRNRCLSAGLLVADECGTRFAYGYGYCYFLAKYFQENLALLDEPAERAKLFEKLKTLSDRVYSQENANIVIL